MPAAAREPRREVERVRVSDGVDADVHPAPRRGLLDRRTRIVLCQVNGCRAERPRHLEPVRNRVDGDHGRGTGRLRDLHRAQPDRAEAEHRDCVTRLHPGCLDRVKAGRHHVSGKQRGAVFHPFGHLAQHQVRVGDQHLLRLRAGQRAERRAMPEHPTVLAFHVVAPHAEEADSAGGVKAAKYPVADRDAGDPVTGRDHGADELVPDHEPGLDLHAPVVDVEIRAADPGRLDLDDGVVGGDRLRCRNVLDPHLLGRLEGDRAHQGMYTRTAWTIVTRAARARASRPVRGRRRSGRCRPGRAGTGRRSRRGRR